jgi:hypothetical protein
VPERYAVEYAVVRIVPRIDREEFINTGVILHARAAAFLGCEIALDREALRVLDAGGSLDTDGVAAHLQAMRDVCGGAEAGGPIARLSPAERFHWLVAPRSTAIQLSPGHAGVTEDPAATLHQLYATLVARRRD